MLFRSIRLQQPVYGGRIFSSQVAGPTFSSQITDILTSSFDNFNKLKVISTIDKILQDDSFVLSTDDTDGLSFDLGNIDAQVFTAFLNSPPSVNLIDSLINDNKMSFSENFMYLPPIMKVSDSRVPNKSKINTIT